MLNRLLQTVGLAVYSGLAKSGVLSHPAARGGFLKAYGLYKKLIEAGPIERLQDFVPKGSTVIDVGANVGFFALKFADWVGPSGRVVAVEPDPENFAALTEALAKSGLSPRVSARQAVAAGSPGSLRLHRNEIHPGDHKIAIGTETGIDVEALTVDGLVDDVERDKISLIKIDVQGAEMMVLAGAGKTLLTPNLALFVEIDDGALRRFGSSHQELCGFLDGLGFEMYRLARDGAPRLLSRAELSEDLAKKSYVDVLFLQQRYRAMP